MFCWTAWTEQGHLGGDLRRFPQSVMAVVSSSPQRSRIQDIIEKDLECKAKVVPLCGSSMRVGLWVVPYRWPYNCVDLTLLSKGRLSLSVAGYNQQAAASYRDTDVQLVS